MSLSHLAPGSRVWFFIADKFLTEAEATQLSEAISEFVSSWKSHGSALSAGFEIHWNALLTVAVDETIEAPSGCSIDKIFRLLNDFSAATGIDFMNRLLMLVPQPDGTAHIYNRESAAHAINGGELQENTSVVNVMHARLRDFTDNPLQPFRDHWMGKQLLKQNA